MFSPPKQNSITKHLLRFSPLGVGLLLLSLAGCSMAPEYQRPEAPIPSKFPAPEQAAKTLDATMPEDKATPDWQTYFSDPALQKILNDALANNRDLRIAAARVRASRAIYGIQRSDLFPDINVGAQGSRTHTPADLSYTGREVTSSSYQLSANLSIWELDFWGRIRSLEEAALQDYLSQESSQQAFKIALIAQVTNGYLNYRELDQRLVLAQKTLSSREESYRIFKRRFEMGVISELDLTQVETLVKQAQTLTIELEQLKENQLYDLSYLVGSPVQLKHVDSYFGEEAVFQPISPGLPSELLNNRPDILAAEHSLRSATANIGAARAAFFPSITLTGYAGTASAELDGLFASGSGAWSFAPSINLPIFNGGRNQSNLDLSKARQNEAVSNYEKTVQNAFKEVSVSLSNQKWLKKQLKVLEDTLSIQQRRAHLAELRYKSGATPFLEVLDAERARLSAEQTLVTARRALSSSQVELYTAIGGGLTQKQKSPAPQKTGE
ncbi:efflux transporter outer membrane subunit [Hydrogenovibrio thermophilus]|uniref:Efflux transporter outer membrane subunit n=1 Tax=Hydrogenovibrio thermophilus TaxID=265883 RepID=A0A410H5Y9_9GAMM|nr:efflux transporter outer membrane subunit [Hydrogenovibrio thermophilus]QAB16335.1 efflux transporter outer membrane subunit [Hydrogenovibrio thermophilus]